LPAAAWVGSLLGQDAGRPLLVVVPREADALAWIEAARLFGGESEEKRAIYFPAPSLSPYQETETSLMVRSQEAVALDRAIRGEVAAVVCTPRALFRRLPRPQDFQALTYTVRPDEEHPIEDLVAHLVRCGYHRTDLVMEVGDLAVRGGVFDFFPPGEDGPVRLDLFGDTVESIRRFDPQSQRSEERLDAVHILPLVPFLAGEQEAAKLARLLATAFEGETSEDVAERLTALHERGSFPGWENYLPLLAETTVGLMDLFPRALTVAVDPEALREEADHHAALLAEEAKSRLEAGRLAVPAEELELPLEAVHTVLTRAELKVLGLVIGQRTGPEATGGSATAGVDFAGTVTDLFHGQIPRFPTEVGAAHARGDRVILVVVPEHRSQMVEMLEGRNLRLGAGAPDTVEVVEGELQRGFRLPGVGVSVYSERQLFDRVAPAIRSRSRAKARYGPFVASLRDLKVGDYIVHQDHGIGQFVALREISPESSAPRDLPPTLRESHGKSTDGVEVMEIVYAKGKTLLMPLSRLDEVQKYSGIEGVAPRLDTLGGTSWNKTKSRVKRSLRDMAAELVKLYAERQLARAPTMGDESDLERQFGAAFAFDETPDQLDAIHTLQEDLQNERPMDRLLCGDVGYGKTEVAMRAAFKVVDSGHQVAVLAPTTILADQHLTTFRRRFANFPVTIDMVSRFRSNAEVKEIADKLKAGKIDILIGTHRLLSRQLEFAKLGLLIVDEEQRFGVAQKERLKQFKKNIHVLAMSATPVPRTLQLSLAGVRDLSVIETPPKDRMAVETAILPGNPELVREAIEFELERGGQVYYVYNRVENIEAMLAWLKELVPQARITVGHGQMDEKELARRMHSFTEGEHDVLLATTIIENGIDIPNVNTMIVHRADRFGLAQLYQLRGRVGRSDQLAYCYLLVPTDQVLSEMARKRLAAIREFTDLGAGFRIAARDLEIRGAGNLLGAEQSGHITAVGIETYLKMLEETVREMKGEAVEEGPSATIDLPVAMAIPESYVRDANLRMEIYRRIAAAEEPREELLEELQDRFGAPPAPVHTLVEVAELKRLAERLRVQGISSSRGRLTLRLRQDARVQPETLIGLVHDRPGATFSPTGVLTLPAPGGDETLRLAREIVDLLAAPSGPAGEAEA